MTDSIKVVNFKDNYQLLTKMPIYIKSNVKLYVSILLFLFLVIFAVIVFCYADLDRASNGFEKWVGFFVLCFFILFLFIPYTMKEGAFVLAADEKGIYYRIFGRKDDFMLIEWTIINEIVDSYYDDFHRIDVLTMIKNCDIPKPCNAGVSTSHKTENKNISFIMPNSKKSTEVKLKLDELRVKSQKAMLA